MMFTMVGVIVVINQGLLLKKFGFEKFTEARLEIIMLLVLSISSLMVSTEILPLFYLSFIGSGTGQAILRVVITSQAAAAADPAKKGEDHGNSLCAHVRIHGGSTGIIRIYIRDPSFWSVYSFVCVVDSRCVFLH